MPRTPGRAGSPSDIRATTALGVARTALGVVMVAAPQLLPRLGGADRLSARRLAYLGRMVAGRELAVGLGTLRAVRRREPADAWVMAQGLCDAGDALSMVVALRRGHVSRAFGTLVTVAGAAGAIGDILLLRRLRAGA